MIEQKPTPRNNRTALPGAPVPKGVAFLFLFCAVSCAAIHSRESARQTAARIAASMDDDTLVSQLIMVALDNKNYVSAETKTMLTRYPAGAIMLFKYNLNTDKDAVRSFISSCAGLVESLSGVAPFMAVDHEGGLVHRFGPGVQKLPSAYSFWEMAESKGRAEALAALSKLAFSSAREIRSLGITLNLAPVAEVLTGDNEPFLETRSYGRDISFVDEAASVFVRAMDKAGVACVLKHFPGSPGADPHKESAALLLEREELDNLAKPFAGVIKSAPPAAVMVSHAIIPAIDGKENASLSPVVMNGWLKGALGFTGFVLADDFAMGAVAGRNIRVEEAACKALASGADMVMAWPKNIGQVHRSIVLSREAGLLDRKRLEEAAARIIEQKIRYGLLK
ncbi:MAG: glycoside hydrolase family 3 protein [Treponema sp.]|jgi:beta-N-acetylhexosaminidase|nr:glycoside hydrolase family 3 protein [Treponema sp.]